jgi:hypothetical protein
MTLVGRWLGRYRDEAGAMLCGALDGPGWSLGFDGEGAVGDPSSLWGGAEEGRKGG